MHCFPATTSGHIRLVFLCTGANVRQRHHEGLVELFFDVEVHWLEADAQATISITSDANTAWTAAQHVLSTSASQEVVTLLVCTLTLRQIDPKDTRLTPEQHVLSLVRLA